MLTFSIEYFDVLKDFADKFVEFIQKLKTNQSFCNYLQNIRGLELLIARGDQEAINSLFIIDVSKCFNLVSNLYDFTT